MTEEFYHKDLFGAVVDIDLGGERPGLNPDSQGPALGKRGDFNVFSLTDAVGARDKRRAWIIYQQALASGLSAEEIFFRIVWQVKSILIVGKAKNASETDMKPFTYNKSKSFLKNFTTSELKKLSENLVLGYHQARRGKGEVETLIEKILLSL